MRLMLAIRVFFVALFNGAVAERIKAALETTAGPAEDEKPQKPKAAPVETPQEKPARSEAITLLAALQREARFVDLTQESLDEYSDEQVGAAARDVLRDCRTVLDRLFKLTPVLAEEEGAEIDVPAGFDTGSYRLTGNVAGQPPFRGSLVHHGWKAAKCEVPQWSGSKQAARVVAPAEVEL